MRRALVLTVFALSLAGVAGAAEPRLISDANNDGKVTLSEYQANRRGFVMKADKDRDGKVSRAEAERAAADLRLDLEYAGLIDAKAVGRSGGFERMDANRDGVITPAEVDAVTKARFARFDLNHDGVFDRDEARALEKTSRVRSVSRK
jgi:hypothetical protein